MQVWPKKNYIVLKKYIDCAINKASSPLHPSITVSRLQIMKDAGTFKSMHVHQGVEVSIIPAQNIYHSIRQTTPVQAQSLEHSVKKRC